MSLLLEFASKFVDNAYQAVASSKTCSLVLQEDLFDGEQYTPNTFFEYTKQFFDKPELFFGEGNVSESTSINKVFDYKAGGFSFYDYPSPFSTQWAENCTASFNFFSKKEKSDTILLFAPGWARPNLRAEVRFCRRLLANEIDSALLIKPFHQNRAPKGFYSGELFISGNIFLTIMNFRQFVSEIQLLIKHFRKDYKYVGLIGMSSGGFQSGIAAVIQEVDFYFPIITGATLGSIAWDGKLTEFVKKDIQKKGFGEFELNRVWGISDQVFLGQNCKAKHIKQFISLYDEIVLTKYQYNLWEIYNKPELTEMHCAHSSVFFYFNQIVS